MAKETPTLGLKANWKQFTLLVVVNAFVGGMVGLERSIFPAFAAQTFGLTAASAILSFIMAFGLSKAAANYFAGKLANVWGRRKVLILGWLLALPVPILLINAGSWSWVVFANVLLGFSQGLTWSSTVVMKIDLVGDKQRGLAMGINEFAGYLSVGITAFVAGYIANRYGITPYPFYLGLVIAVLGLLFSVFWVKDTRGHLAAESQASTVPMMHRIFWETTVKNKTLSSVTQAGFVNNLNDGMIWGLLPILLVSMSYNQEKTAIISAIYPAVWGLGQLFTGSLSDRYNKKRMLFWGMFIQGIAILLLTWTMDFWAMAGLSALLGLGTALVYPTFLSTIASVTAPVQRAESLGAFRLWRDLGYAVGALISGLIADRWGLEAAIVAIGLVTLASAMVIAFRMPEYNLTEKQRTPY
jgi:MFS family permease